MPEDDSLAGAWRLVSAIARAGDAAPTMPFGPHPAGILTYGHGFVTVIISDTGRQALSTPDRHGAAIAEQAAAFATSFAYAGPYSVWDGTVAHHVEVSTIENWVGSTMIRHVELEPDGSLLRLTTAPVELVGAERVFELLWARAT